jgi:antagonist of KipI
MPGPEFDRLTGISQQALLNVRFTITKESDRMGFRLSGPPLHKLSMDEMLSSGTTLGTMQLLPDGQIIVLMADHQTTGGYPRIGVLASIDILLMAQLGPGDKVSFDLIENADAEHLALRFERDLAFLRTGIRVANGTL